MALFWVSPKSLIQMKEIPSDSGRAFSATSLLTTDWRTVDDDGTGTFVNC
ncbi:hypothetical protein SDJN02_22804, partial [Cucurbita argyrosperma subsp. argyrosperma]